VKSLSFTNASKTQPNKHHPLSANYVKRIFPKHLHNKETFEGVRIFHIIFQRINGSFKTNANGVSRQKAQGKAKETEATGHFLKKLV